MGGGRRRGAIVRPGGIQQHLQWRYRVQLRRFLVHLAWTAPEMQVNETE